MTRTLIALLLIVGLVVAAALLGRSSAPAPAPPVAIAPAPSVPVAPAPAPAATEPADPTVSVDDDDPEMIAAIAKARQTLPRFWEHLVHPLTGETDFELKVKVTDDKGSEYLWAEKIERVNGKIFGVIDNEPDTVKSIKLGQRIEIPEADIADWMYQRGGKTHGNQTLRALFHLMKPDEVLKYKATLAAP